MMAADDSSIKRRFRQNCGFVFFLLKAWHWGIVLILFTLFVPWVNATNPCNEAQFWVVKADGTSSCVDCESCHSGHGLSHECGKRISSNAMVTCVPCQEGITFSSKYDTSMCRPCSGSCSEDQVVLQLCTPMMDVECAKQCYSKDKYYDDFNSCMLCSKCCGDGQDVVENECRQKLGAASNMICSFYSSVNRCDITTTVSSRETTTTISPASTQLPFTLAKARDTRATTSVTLPRQSTVTQGVLSSPHLHVLDIQVNRFVIGFVAVFGLLLAIAGGVYYVRCAKQRCSSLHVRHHDPDIEMQDLGDKAKQSCVVMSDEGVEEKIVLKNEKVHVKLGEITESTEPLLSEESEILTSSGQEDTKKVSKLLKSLLDDGIALQGICEHLDTPVPRCGHFREVAQYYKFNHCQIHSVLKTHSEGPTRALIEWIAATYPNLTVEEFASVVWKKTKRNDVIELLSAYDSAN